MGTLKGRHANALFAAMHDRQLQAIRKLVDIFQQLTHGNDREQPPRVETMLKQAVACSKTQPHITPLLRVQKSTLLLRVHRNNGPHTIPTDDDMHGNLPLPDPHPISIPTPKGGPFYIPPEDDDIGPIHWYSTRNQT
eukprot:14649720-Ditylum_brightwellii.AAC.1